MALNIQGWNPTLLASLAMPNNIDFAGRMSQMENNNVTRQKMLAELAYLPVQQQNEALKNQAYLLQQGYMIGPDGKPVMTPAKQAELQYLNSRLQNMGGRVMTAPQQGGQLQPVDVNQPQIEGDIPGWMQTAMGDTGTMSDASMDNGSLTDSSDAQMAGQPTMQMAQATPQALPYSKEDIDMANIFPKFGKASDMLTANKIAQDAVLKSPEFQGKQELSKAASKAAVDDLTKRREKADDAVLSLQSTAEARNLLDSGIITGAGADYILNFDKALDQIGLGGNEEGISNTEAFIAARAGEVGRQIKQFGSGTGLSDADREYAQQMAAGKIKLNEGSIKKILNISDRANKNVIKLYNKKASVYSDVPEMNKLFNTIDVDKIIVPKEKSPAKAGGKDTNNDGVIDWKDL